MREPSGPALPDVGVLGLVPDAWSTLWQPRHHVLSRLARYYRVSYLEPAAGWRDAFARNSSERATAPESPPGLVVRAPEPWLPKFFRPGWLSRLTFDARLRRARRDLVRRGCRKIVLYTWRPDFERALDAIAFDLSCYHIDDEYSFSSVEQTLDPRERRLIEKSDRVFIHSPALLEKKGELNPHTTFVPNGVDYAAHANPADEPADLRDIPRPRIGYTGRVKRQLDWPLIEALVRRHPQWQFVFVGAAAPHEEVNAARERMADCPNVHFLGAKAVWDLAVYPQHFDVCVMPYRVDDYTRFIYPMKVNEYLAAGAPIVGSPIRSLEAFGHVVELADTPEAWSAAIARALEPEAHRAERRAARQTVARENDWDRLTAKIARIMAEGLGPDVVERFDTAQAREPGA
jgi:glycosyltransferase involved in cell wall biosynthesis